MLQLDLFDWKPKSSEEVVVYDKYTFLDGTIVWCLEGQLHREEGPAVEYPNGTKLWFLDGKRYTEEEWEEEVKKL